MTIRSRARDKIAFRDSQRVPESPHDGQRKMQERHEMGELFNENFRKPGAAAQRVSPPAKFRFVPAFNIAFALYRVVTLVNKLFPGAPKPRELSRSIIPRFRKIARSNKPFNAVSSLGKARYLFK